MRNLKQALNHWLVFKTVHRVIKFNKKAWLKPYIDMNTKLREKAKTKFKKNFLKLVNNAVLEKLWKMWQNIEILDLSQPKKKELFSIWTKLSNYKVFHRNSIDNRNEKNSNIDEYVCLFRLINTRSNWNCNVWILVWLCKNKMWWKCKTLLYGLFM